MSAQEIIAELPKMTRQELESLSSKVNELLSSLDEGNDEPSLMRFAGLVKGLPSDLARNHDHYLHGQPKK